MPLSKFLAKPNAKNTLGSDSGSAFVIICTGTCLKNINEANYTLIVILVLKRTEIMMHNWAYFLEGATFSSLSIRTSIKVLHNFSLGQLRQPQRSNRISNFWPGHK